MFEVGKEYEFIFLTATENGLSETSGQRWHVQKVDGTLLHLHSPAWPETDEHEFLGSPAGEENMILNTASSFFHSARPAAEIDAEDQKRRVLAEKRGGQSKRRNRATGMTA